MRRGARQPRAAALAPSPPRQTRPPARGGRPCQRVGEAAGGDMRRAAREPERRQNSETVVSRAAPRRRAARQRCVARPPRACVAPSARTLSNEKALPAHDSAPWAGPAATQPPRLCAAAAASAREGAARWRATRLLPLGGRTNANDDFDALALRSQLGCPRGQPDGLHTPSLLSLCAGCTGLSVKMLCQVALVWWRLARARRHHTTID